MDTTVEGQSRSEAPVRSVSPILSLQNGRRFRLLDAIRGISALAVVSYHSLPNQTPTREFVAANPTLASLQEWIFYVLTCGYLGVPVFFLISGYCICAAATAHVEKGYSPSRFFKRRIIRIYSPYWICFALCVGLSFVPGTNLHPSSLTVTQWLGNIFLFENYRPWLLPPSAINLLLEVSWTLCYEEQFYMVTGLILWFAPRALFPIFGTLTVFVLLNNYNLNIGPLKQLGDLNSFQFSVDGLLIDPFWLFFAAGIGLFCFRTSTSRLRFLFPLLLSLLIFWEVRQLDWYTNRFASRVTTFSVALVLCGVERWDSKISSLDIFKPFFWLGTRSYSIYLIHLPFVRLINSLETTLGFDSIGESLAVTLPVSVLIALCAGHWFYRFVERHWIPGSN